MNPTRCTGEFDRDCPNAPVATVESESSSSAQEYCTDHLKAVQSGYCGFSIITYYATGERVIIDR